MNCSGLFQQGGQAGCTSDKCKISEDSFCQTKFVSLRRGRVSATNVASGRFEGKGKVSVPLAMIDE